MHNPKNERTSSSSTGLLKLLCCHLFAGMVSAAVFGGNICTWTGGSVSAPNDWTDAANWEGGVKPVAGNDDTVVIPNEMSATLDASDAASCRLVAEGGLALIKMIGRPGDKGITKTGSLIVNVGKNDADLTIYCQTLGYRTAADADSDATSGLVIKRGAGILRLRPGALRDDYYTSFTVEEGDLVLPQEVKNMSYYSSICISNNATLHLPATTGEKYQVRIYGVLEGEGVITNSHANGYSDIQLSVQGAGTFNGKLTNLRLFADGRLDLTGSESTMTSMPTAEKNEGAGPSGVGVLGVKTFGTRGKPSSVGKGDGVVFGGTGGVIRYIGEEDETTDRYIYWQIPKAQMNFLDGGPRGGIKFSSDSAWADWSSDANKGMKSLGLCGEGVVGTNEMAGKIEATVVGENTCRMHIVKSGASTWRFRDNAKRDGIGGITVKDGTIQFDTIAEKGVMCALGTAVDCHTNYWGAYDANAKVDYAFLLGSENAQGALEYTGTADAECSTRPIALSGKGGKLLNSTAAGFRFGGVAPVPGSASASTLTLGGSGANGNVIAAVTDTPTAPISIEKEGTGEWAVDSTCAVHGKVIAAGGRLIGKEDRKYTWFRLNVKDVITNAGSTEMSGFSLMKFFLYNDKGERQNADLTYNAGLDPTKLAPGETVCTMFQNGSIKANNPEVLFTDVITGTGFAPWPVLDPSDETGTKCLRIYVRLREGADPVVAYDLASQYKSNASQWGRNVKTYTLEGSTDGICWYELDSIADTTDPDSPMKVNPDRVYSYYSDGVALDADKLDARVKEDGTPCGPAISSICPDGRTAFDDVSGFVLAGGTVAQEDASTPIDNLTVDAVKGGTLDNFTFADTGTLNVLNLPKGGSVELPLAFANVPVGEIAKLANWLLKIGGEVKSSKSIAIRNGKVYIDSAGLLLIFR